MTNRMKFLLTMLVMAMIIGAPSAWAATLNKTLTAAFTANASNFTTALNGSVGQGVSYSCQVYPAQCDMVSVTVHLRSPAQADLDVQVLVSNNVVTLTKTTETDGSLTFTGQRLGGGIPFSVKLQLKSNNGSPVTLTPANNDYLSLHAATYPST